MKTGNVEIAIENKASKAHLSCHFDCLRAARAGMQHVTINLSKIGLTLTHEYFWQPIYCSFQTILCILRWKLSAAFVVLESGE